MTTIKDYIQDKLKTQDHKTLAERLGVSGSMLSQYKKEFNPSLKLAMTVYHLDKVVLHPFAEESLKKELNGH